jgi:hypothetical protein
VNTEARSPRGFDFNLTNEFLSFVAGVYSNTVQTTLKGPIHFKLNCTVKLCKNTARKTELDVLWHSTFPNRFVSFFVSSVCLLVRVTVVDINKAVVSCLIATSAIMLSKNKKREHKMWSKKWHLKRNILCDVHLLNELLETEFLEMIPSWCRQVN